MSEEFLGDMEVEQHQDAQVLPTVPAQLVDNDHPSRFTLPESMPSDSDGLGLSDGLELIEKYYNENEVVQTQQPTPEPIPEPTPEPNDNDIASVRSTEAMHQRTTTST